MRVVGIYWTIGDSASSRVKLDWIAPQVVAVRLDQVEGVQENAFMVAVAAVANRGRRAVARRDTVGKAG
jgi:hypothetical protein